MKKRFGDDSDLSLPTTIYARQQMLPILVPLVLNLLQTGSQTRNPQGGANPVLNAFLDADRDGDVDISDANELPRPSKTMDEVSDASFRLVA